MAIQEKNLTLVSWITSTALMVSIGSLIYINLGNVETEALR